MHLSSHEAMRAFVRVHLEAARGRPLEILDFGSQMVDGQPLSYRDLFDDPKWRYRGLDIEAGVNVDVVVADAYDWGEGVPSDSIDLVVSGQALEHVEYFWASIFEIVRVLKPGGVATIIAPSAGFEHRYPVDCWRFYRDGFSTLARYVSCEVVDVFTDWDNEWSDSTLVLRKPIWSAAQQDRFARRSAMQRALIVDDETLALAFVDPVEAVGETEAASSDVASILRTVQAGALAAELGAMRAERLRVAEAATDAQNAAAAASTADLENRLEAALADAAAANARADRADARATALARESEESALRSNPLYGRIRGQIAEIAGPKGRGAYKRLRGRGPT